MTEKEVLQHLCETVAMVYHTHDDYSQPSDGFCEACMRLHGPQWHFEHAGETLRWLRRAAVEKLVREGYVARLDVLCTPSAKENAR